MTDARHGLHRGVRGKVGAFGVDRIKVGSERVPQTHAVLDALACSGRAIVPVFTADVGLDARGASS